MLFFALNSSHTCFGPTMLHQKLNERQRVFFRFLFACFISWCTVVVEVFLGKSKRRRRIKKTAVNRLTSCPSSRDSFLILLFLQSYYVSSLFDLILTDKDNLSLSEFHAYKCLSHLHSISVVKVLTSTVGVAILVLYAFSNISTGGALL